ncbi:hypothetical protein Tco_1232818, partial [Tanacetum coccineum]
MNKMPEQNVPLNLYKNRCCRLYSLSVLTIRESNFFNAQKIQKNPIFQISVDILSNTNFFQAFTASANVPAIYLQQFWNTMKYNEKTGVYSCQVDEQWFDLSVDLLRKALAITPVNPTHPFELPPSGNTVIDFVNELGYPEPVEIVSNIRVNYVYQPWRAILTLINQCLTGKTSGSDKPRHPVLQMLWGIITLTILINKLHIFPCLFGIHCISKFPSIYIQLFWNTLTHDAKTGRSLLHDNIVPKPDLALELGKSISLTEAEEEAVAREVHATHARIVSGPDPEPMQEDQTGSNSGKLHVSLAGPNPEHMDDEFLATAYPKVHENLKLITDERVIEENPESHSGSMSSMKNLDDTYNFGDQFLYDKPTEDDQEKSKVIEESDSTIPDPSHQTVTSTPPVIAPFTDVSSIKPSSLVSPPPINTEATTITTSLPEITPFIALQLRVARLEQEMSEVKKTDHSADSIKNQESEKSPKEIIRIKREQGEEKQDSTYSIRSTDKVALEEFDLKSALFKHMNKNKTANRNPANYHLYHALMEALIADKDAMDKEVKDLKRKHDDDDDEGPSARSNQGKSTKRRRHDLGASGSAQPTPKDHEQSLK